jgi:hypothetical protein
VNAEGNTRTPHEPTHQDRGDLVLEDHASTACRQR